MIEYALLCQTIADWRAGRRPTLPPSSSPTLGGAAATRAAVSDDEAEVIDAGDADIEDDAMYPVAEAEVPLEQDYDAPAEAAPPPDYDSTMVYGAGGAMPGQWSPDGAPPTDADHDPQRS